MGWYLKKSFAFGPLRLNLSKSGIGASVGVKGLRVSTGPKGRQLNAGREGLYYRASLNSPPHPPVSDPKIDIEPETTNNDGTKEKASLMRPTLSTPNVSNATQAAPEPNVALAVASSVGRQVGTQLWRKILGGLLRGR